MTLKLALTDDQIGQYTKKTIAILDRLGKSLDFEQVMTGLQLIHDGKLDPSGVSQEVVARLLEPITTIELAAVESFVAKDKFREGKTIDGVKIYWTGDNFKRQFMGKTERGAEDSTLRIQKLMKDSLDAPILAELGDTAETTLSHFWELLKKQGNGQPGDLLVNGYANFAYIRDVDGNLWAVRARWRDGRGWSVEAISVADPGEWSAGDQVVSR